MTSLLVLDSGAITRLSRRDGATAARLLELRRRGLWPALTPTMAMIESLTGSAGLDSNVNRFLKTCDIKAEVSEAAARRSSQLRTRARTGSAVDALVVTLAEPGGTVLTSDEADLRALAAYAVDVRVEPI
jgi:hypothetical protein